MRTLTGLLNLFERSVGRKGVRSMQTHHQSPPLLLRVQPQISYLPVVFSFVYSASLSFRIGVTASESLALAADEFFSYLCGQRELKSLIEVEALNGIYYGTITFRFTAPNLDLHALNITSKVLPDNPSSLETLGLVIASRSCDQFHVTEHSGTYAVSFVKEKSYPSVDAEFPTGVPEPDAFFIGRPTIDMIIQFCLMAERFFGHTFYLVDFSVPGKVVDMVESGEYDIIVAADQKHRICGGLLWGKTGKAIAECYGPYVFTPEESRKELSRSLIEKCIEKNARTSCRGIILYNPSGCCEAEDFEILGKVRVNNTRGEPMSVTVLFRALHEDSGCTVMAHPSLVPFLREEYKRLVLPREIRQVPDTGERWEEHSLLGPFINRKVGIALVTPLIFGRDARRLLESHVSMFVSEGIRNIFFPMDLANAWETKFSPHLLSSGFEPKYIVPFGGTADVVFFQWRESS